MLVLLNKVGERILIGEGIEVAVIKISGNRVRLGVTAAPDVSVRRLEVRTETEEAILSNELQAGEISP